MEVLLEFIATQLSLITKEWFSQKELFFKKEPFYNKSQNKIFEIISNIENLQDSNGEFIQINNDTIIDKDFHSYCWDSFFYGSLNYQENISNISETDFPIDGATISSNIVFESRKLIDELSDVRAKFKLTSEALGQVKSSIENLSKETPDESPYKNWLSYFFARFQKQMLKEFRLIDEEIGLLEYQDKLEFNLKQEELAALLFIINKSGFLRTIDYNDTSFLKFCSNYFYFKKKDAYCRPSSLKSFSDKYREYLRGDYSTVAYEKVRRQLLETLKSN